MSSQLSTQHKQALYLFICPKSDIVTFVTYQLQYNIEVEVLEAYLGLSIYLGVTPYILTKRTTHAMSKIIPFDGFKFGLERELLPG